MSGKSSQSPVSGEASGLIGGLGVLQATAVVVSTIIGTGVFLVASPMARMAGSANLVLITWIIGTVIAVSGTLCFAELGAALPEAGGLFVYLSRGLGPIWGFLFGWMNSLLACPVGMATLAAGFVMFAGFLFPGIEAPLFTLHAWHRELVFKAAQPLAAGVVVAMTALNCLSVRVGGGLQVLLGSLKVGAIAAIILAGAVFAKPATQAAGPALALPHVSAIGAVLSALVPVMWAYNGLQNLGCLGAEIHNPAKNIPRALACGLLVVSSLYVLVNITYFHVLPFKLVAQSQHVASDAVASILGSRSAAWLTMAMGISALASLHAVIMAESRIPYAMARNGLFFSVAARVQPRFRSPSGALLFLGVLSALMALTGTFEELFSLYVFVMWIFFALGALTVVRLRSTESGLPRPYCTWGYPWTPFVFATAALALTVHLWMERPVRSSLGLVVILAGLPFYYAWRRDQREDATPIPEPSTVS